MRSLTVLLAATVVALHAVSPAPAQSRTGSDSGLPLPRFVSLKSSKVNMRVGPGRDYRVEWEYRRAGLPVEITAEFDKWRRVRDADGTEGWVYGALLSGRRTAVVAPWLARDAASAGPASAEPASVESVLAASASAGAVAGAVTVPLRVRGERNAPLRARLEPGVSARLIECDGTWCRIEPYPTDPRLEGWVRQTELWGAYPDERIDG